MISRELVEGFRGSVESLWSGWRAEGETLFGPEGMEVTLARRGHHSESPRHLDVHCRFPKASGDHPGLWDCLTGFGETEAEIGEAAGIVWSRTTGSAFLELLLSQQGKYAAHLRGKDSFGFPGWHAITAGFMGMGDAESAAALQQWSVETPYLAEIAPALASDLSASEPPRGLKFLLGGDDDAGAEVALDGEPHQAASAILAGLDWPRRKPYAFIRGYVLLVHPERASGLLKRLFGR